MKAITYASYGGPDSLEYGEVSDPKVGPDTALIRVKAAAVNPVDWKIQAGYLDSFLDAVFPVIPGWDVAGIVERVGVGATEFEPGDEVIGYVREDMVGRGTFAEFVAAPVRTLAHKPTNLTFEESAGIPLAGLTAYQSLVRHLRLQAGETVLVHAAAGGVGQFAVQIARSLGVRVIGTASEANHGFLRELGAEPVSYGPELADQVRALSPEGVDATLDLFGGAGLQASPALTKDHQRIVSIADAAVLGLGGSYLFVRPDAADLTALSALAERGVLRVEVAAEFPLEQAAQALRLSMGGHTRGKIIITVP
ncbi:NADP-dependent oxidoreductase [Streptacidiphilus rugosus]|uniref:NADP-dependent oxidoreductase n=1 Tax=Streptacidiphilus rugosus TaxID=405783 RepID=UPI00056306BE|nr:NADP-dependent oxidoreductase [Streptacidiphilus rugosus]